MIEEWKDIEGYNNYQVSNSGKVRSLSYGRTGKIKLLKPTIKNNGYLVVHLYKNLKPKTFHIHRLVSQAFIPNPNNLPEVNHKDENKQNNCVFNLEWCDREYNCNYGNFKKKLSEFHKGLKPSEKAICKAIESNSKPILQYDKEGKLIKEWPSATIAGQELGIKRKFIYRCCKGGRKSTGGYVWAYK